jgi:SAM-dependent methyltransferase
VDIQATIITAVSDSAGLARFYEDAYSRPAGEGELYARWRALGAVGKADHVVGLCRRAGIEPSSTLEVGCGDGALLAELGRRGFGGRLSGVEIAAAAVQIAQRRPGLESVDLYDGSRLPAPDGAYDLGILSHVLEHVPQPAALLAETARVCRAVVVEVPLEDNLSARRASRRVTAQAVGHLQRFDRAGARAVAAAAGLRLAGELEDPLPLTVHRFFATTPRARSAATAKWALRAATAALAPPLARRLFTLHYAFLCRPQAA